MNNKEKFELAVNAGLQAIPYVGGPSSGMSMMLNASEFGKRFNNFCLQN